MMVNGDKKMYDLSLAHILWKKRFSDKCYSTKRKFVNSFEQYQIKKLKGIRNRVCILHIIRQIMLNLIIPTLPVNIVIKTVVG